MKTQYVCNRYSTNALPEQIYNRKKLKNSIATYVASRCFMLLSITSYCSLLPHIALYCFILLSIASCCSPLLLVALHCLFAEACGVNSMYFSYASFMISL